MIHYDLQCDADHRFDGWFKDSGSFDRQAAHGMLECPVRRHQGGARADDPVGPEEGPRSRPVPPQPPEKPPASPQAPVAVAGQRMPDHVRAIRHL